MTYIPPNSTLQVFSDLGLSMSHDDSLYFSSTSAKDDYFTNLVIRQYTELTYQRRDRNFIRVQDNISHLYNMSYMRYRNTSYENKWFYAFITNVEYVNNEVTEITFEYDPLMTWMGAFELKECFIERQHTINDGIGNNIADEGLETGEYITEAVSRTPLFDHYNIVIMDARGVEGGSAGNVYGGLYSGCYKNVATTVTGANDTLQAKVSANQEGDIIGVKMYPDFLTADNVTGSDEPTKNKMRVLKRYNGFDGYYPKNNKLYCYPYKMLTVYNGEGESVDLKYEYFNTVPPASSNAGEYCDFDIYGYASSIAEVVCIPQNYMGNRKRGSDEWQSNDYSNMISIKNFPSCSYAIDSYRAMIAQRESNLPAELLASAVTISGTIATGGNLAFGGAMGQVVRGNPAMDTVSNISSDFTARRTGQFSKSEGFNASVNTASASKTVLGELATRVWHPTMSMQARGSQTGNIMDALRDKNFYFYHKSITKNYAMMIDDYFTMFGYAIRQKNVPNMNARPSWTYVKTLGCVVHGDLPSSDATAIEAIFDKGVRFWKNHNNIGNYDLNNAPL